MSIDKKINFSATENVTPLLERIKKAAEEARKKMAESANSILPANIQENIQKKLIPSIQAIPQKKTAYRSAEQINRERATDILREKIEAQGLSGKGALGYIEKEAILNKQRKKDLGGKTTDQGDEAVLARNFEEVAAIMKNNYREQANQEAQLIKETKEAEKKKIKDIKDLEKNRIKEIKDDEKSKVKAEKEGIRIKQEEEKAADLKAAKRAAQFMAVSSALKTVGNVTNTGLGIATNQNTFFMQSAMIGLIPFIGQGLKGIMDKAFSSAEKFQNAAGGLRQLTGGRNVGGGALTGIGMSGADTLEYQRQVALSMGKTEGSYEKTRDIAYLEKATGFDKAGLLEQEKLTRGGGLGAVGGTQLLTKGLQSIGVVKGQETNIMNEYLPILVDIQKEQLKATGETNNIIATDLVTGIANLDASFKNPEYLKTIIPSIMQGMKTASTPQVEALQYRMLSMLPGNEGKTLNQLQIQKENPTVAMFTGMLEQIKSMSPNEDVFARNILGAYPELKELTKATQIAQGYNAGNLKIEDYSKELGIKDIIGKGGTNVSEMTKKSAEMTSTFEVGGGKLMNSLDKLADTVGIDGVATIASGINKFADAISGFADWVNSMTGGKDALSKRWDKTWSFDSFKDPTAKKLKTRGERKTEEVVK